VKNLDKVVRMGKGKSWSRSFSKICRQKGLSTHEDILRHNMKHLANWYDLSLSRIKSTVIERVRSKLSKDQILNFGKGKKKSPGIKIAGFNRNGKGKNGKHFWRSWSTLSGGEGRLQNGAMTFVDTYIPEAIFDMTKNQIRRRKPTDPEPKPCAPLLNVMAEMFPEDAQSAVGEISSKVDGTVIKTEVVAEDNPVIETEKEAEDIKVIWVEAKDIPDNRRDFKVKGSATEVKTESIQGKRKIQRSNNADGQNKGLEPQNIMKKTKYNDGKKKVRRSNNGGGEKKACKPQNMLKKLTYYDGSKGGDGGFNSYLPNRSTDNRFNPYCGGKYGYESSRAWPVGSSSDRSTANSSGGWYGCNRPRAGYGGSNSGAWTSSSPRQSVYNRSRAGYGGSNSDGWISANVMHRSVW